MVDTALRLFTENGYLAVRVEEQVTGAIEDAARQMLTQERLARFVHSLPVRHSSLLRPGARTTPHVMGRVDALLEQGQASGEISRDVPLDLLTRHVHAALEAAMRDWAEGRTDDVIAHLRILLGLAFHGMAPRSKPAASTREHRDRSE